jgi:hypothetical protein
LAKKPLAGYGLRGDFAGYPFGEKITKFLANKRLFGPALKIQAPKIAPLKRPKKRP